MSYDLSGTDIDGSPSFQIAKDSASAKRVCKVDWSDIDSAITGLFGTVFMAGTGVVRDPLHTFPGKSYLVLDQMDIKPFDDDNIVGSSGGLPTYTSAQLELTYKTKPYNTDDDDDTSDDPDVPEGTYLTHRISLGGDILTLPESGLQWQAANDDGIKDVAADVAPGMVIPTIEHQFTWHFVPSPPFAAMKNAYGKVNSALQYGAPAETLLFLGADANRDITTEGTKAWTLDYRFQEKALKAGGVIAGWNHFFRPDPGAGQNSWQKILRKDGNTVYETADFSSLFEFSAGAA